MVKREPAFYIGLAVSVVLAVLSVLTGQGVVSDAIAGQITDATNAIAQLALIFAPLITGILIRPTTTPVAAPALPTGTTVTVYQPGVAGSGTPTTL